MREYNQFIKIPEAKSGNMEIKHLVFPANTEFTTETFSVLQLNRIAKVYKNPNITIWHELLENGGRWMSDLPSEQAQMEQAIKDFKGCVLVGGLGLGLVVQLLALKDEVTKIVVVERSLDVINLVSPYIKGSHKIHFVCANLFDFIENTEIVFDKAFYDIWHSDGEHTFHSKVIPLLKKSTRILDKLDIVCWNEDVMREHLYIHLVALITLMNNTNISGISKSKFLLKLISPLAILDGYTSWTVEFFTWIYNNAIEEERKQLRQAKLFAESYGRNQILGYNKVTKLGTPRRT